MRKVAVYRNGIFAGILIEENRKQFVFKYDKNYFDDSQMPAISLTLPKSQQEYTSEVCSLSFNMLSEGVNRKLQSTQLRIDEDDSFGLLMATAQSDTIGAVTVKPLIEK
jgi:serine/threonine-protein kinase HipA